jgi:dTMP kinase
MPQRLTNFIIFSYSLLQRGSYGEERYEKLEFQRVVQQQFRLLRSRDESLKLSEEDTLISPPEWAVVDAEKSIEEIQGEVQQIVTNVLERVRRRPIGSLWKRSGTGIVNPTQNE